MPFTTATDDRVHFIADQFEIRTAFKALLGLSAGSMTLQMPLRLQMPQRYGSYRLEIAVSSFVGYLSTDVVAAVN